jgi:hypothetical protein
MSFFGTMILVMIGVWLGSKVEKTFSTDYREDPVYKKNVRDLIERNRRFEKNE